ncbi:MAG TPA: hypothetical protein VH877_00860 [Polyangia bacterium]|jgi:hypothetical protein|nr:hypothetical protein [Polyangia bacterium]
MLFQYRHASRALALFVIGLMLSGRLLALAHLGGVVHRACEEHGELVEVGYPQPAAMLATEHASRLLRAVPVPSGHAHEHCAVAGHHRLSPLPCTAPTVGGATSVTAFALPPAAVPSGPRRALFRLAPKNSPPA